MDRSDFMVRVFPFFSVFALEFRSESSSTAGVQRHIERSIFVRFARKRGRLEGATAFHLLPNLSADFAADAARCQYCRPDSCPVYLQESLSVAISKPFEITEIEKALKAAITEDLVRRQPLFFKIHTNPCFLVLNVPPHLC